MNIADYRNRKEAGRVEIKAHGDGLVTVIMQRFDPLSGDRLPDEVGQVNVAGFDNELKQAERVLASAQKQLDDLNAAIKDISEADAAFGQNEKAGKEILGKTEK